MITINGPQCRSHHHNGDHDNVRVYSFELIPSVNLLDVMCPDCRQTTTRELENR